MRAQRTEPACPLDAPAGSHTPAREPRRMPASWCEHVRARLAARGGEPAESMKAHLLGGGRP